jgi:hypothetical protein
MTEEIKKIDANIEEAYTNIRALLILKEANKDAFNSIQELDLSEWTSRRDRWRQERTFLMNKLLEEQSKN